MSNPDLWMPIYWGDYLKETTHLNTAQHGAYLLLKAKYWTDGKRLPDDNEQLRQIVKMTKQEWAKVRPVISDFFRVEDGFWYHDDMERELEISRTKAEQRKIRASMGGRALKLIRDSRG